MQTQSGDVESSDLAIRLSLAEGLLTVLSWWLKIVLAKASSAPRSKRVRTEKCIGRSCVTVSEALATCEHLPYRKLRSRSIATRQMQLRGRESCAESMPS